MKQEEYMTAHDKKNGIVYVYDKYIVNERHGMRLVATYHTHPKVESITSLVN